MFDHTADLGLRVTADDLPGLFSEAARGLSAVLLDAPDRLAVDRQLRFIVEGTAEDHLLLDLLNELLFRFETTGFIGREFSVERTSEGLRVQATGELVDPDRHRFAHEVKAVTYHGLRVDEHPHGWSAELIVDI